MEKGVLQAKGLSDLDKVYGRLKSYASVDEKLRYCRSLLTRTEGYLEHQNKATTEHIRSYSADLIKAARTEIELLLKQNGTH